MKSGWGLVALGFVAISTMSGCKGCGNDVATAGAEPCLDAGTPTGPGGTAAPQGQRAPFEQGPLAVRPYQPHYVGTIPAGQSQCPAGCNGSTAWRVTRLLDGSAPDRPTKLPAALARYCRYDPAHHAGPPQTPPAPQAEGCQIDPYVVSQQATPSYAPFSGIVKGDLRQQFRRRVQRPSSLSPAPSARVRVAVLDSSPTQVGNHAPGVFDHGFNIASIIEDLTCPGGPPCAANLYHYLALPHLDDWTTPKNGGDLGAPSELATSIVDAVTDWLSSPAREPHLVINLSVGWEPKLWTKPRAADPCFENVASVQAVHDALRFAACNGALVFAAVGNSPDMADLDLRKQWIQEKVWGKERPSPDVHFGSMCPASWQQSAATTCGDFKDAGGQTLPDLSPTQPLVYSVGGLDPLDQPLVGSRRNGDTAKVILPGLNAPAMLAVDYPTASPDLPPGASQVVTGSSVATAVATAAASLAWAYRPDWPTEEVVRMLGASGAPLPSAIVANSDPTLKGLAAPARISIQCIVARAQGLPCKTIPPATDQPTLTAAELKLYPSYDPATNGLLTPVSVSGSGKPSTLAALPTPWVGPQPDGGQCGQTNCSKVGDPYIDIPVPANYPGPVPVTAVTLRVYDKHGEPLAFKLPNAGASVTALPLTLPSGGLYAGGHLAQLLPDVSTKAAIATLTFSVNFVDSSNKQGTRSTTQDHPLPPLTGRTGISVARTAA